jgi:hypothetical protein
MGRSSTVIVQPDASRLTVTDRRTPSTTLVLVALLEPSPDELELDETELLDEPEPRALDEAEAPVSLALTVVRITRPSAV